MGRRIALTLCSDFTADAFVGADAGRNDQTAAVLFHIGFRAAVCRRMGNVFGRLNHIAGRINHGTFLINIAVGSDGGVAAGVDVGYMRCVRYGRCIRFGAGNADRYADACNVIFFVCSSRYAQIGYAAGFGYSVAAFGCNNINVIGCGNVDGFFAIDLAAADGNV